MRLPWHLPQFRAASLSLPPLIAPVRGPNEAPGPAPACATYAPPPPDRTTRPWKHARSRAHTQANTRTRPSRLDSYRNTLPPASCPPPRRAAGGAGPSTCPYWLAYSPYPMPPARPLGPTPLLQLAHALAAPAAVPPTDRLILANKFSPRHFAIHGLHHDTPTHLSYLRPSFGPGPARSSPHVACAASTVLAPTRAHATLAPYPCLRATHWHPQAFPQTLPARP